MPILVELKRRLRITWSEQDEELLNIINRAKRYFVKLTGKDFAFDLSDDETELLLERCRYVYNNAADVFEKSFEDELKRLILNVALEARRNEENP